MIFTSSEIPTSSDVAAVRAATRRWLRADAVDGVLADNVVLVASELATNAVRHARTGFEISLARAEGTRVRVEAFDLDTRSPSPVLPDTEATGGRGLQIIAALSTEWGFGTEERDGVHGKIVWAELDTADEDVGDSRSG